MLKNSYICFPGPLYSFQMGKFRTLNMNELGAAENKTYVDTFRPVEALNGRTVYMNDLNFSGSASIISTVTLGSLITLVLATVLLQ